MRHNETNQYISVHKKEHPALHNLECFDIESNPVIMNHSGEADNSLYVGFALSGKV